MQADLTAPQDLLHVEQRLRTDPAITTLVNNAGMAVSGTMLGADPDRLETMIKLNVIAVTRLAAAAAAGFTPRGHGTIINIASVLALAPELFNGPYSGTKAYVLNLSQSMQAELSKHGLRIQAVLPGATRTEIWERAGTDITALPASILMGVDEMVTRHWQASTRARLLRSLACLKSRTGRSLARHALNWALICRATMRLIVTDWLVRNGRRGLCPGPAGA